MEGPVHQSLRMGRQSNITFNKRIEKGDNRVQLNINRTKLDVGTKFKFQSLTLAPEYFSLQAVQYDMDPDVKDLEYPFQVGWDWIGEYTTTVVGQAWTSTKTMTIEDMLKSINRHFELQKPTGLITPLVILDWIIEGFDQSDLGFLEFHTRSAVLLYGEEYNATKHDAGLSASVKALPFINPLAFPTTKDTDVLRAIRIRLHLAPNAFVAFSNEQPLKAMGWTDNAIPNRTRNQVSFINRSFNAYQAYKADSHILALSIDTGSGFKLAQYILEDNAKGPEGKILTSRTREKKFDLLAEDINQAVEAAFKSINMKVQFLYYPNNKKFDILLASDAKFVANLYLHPSLSERLGYGKVEKITNSMNPNTVTVPGAITDPEKRAKTLVYDTAIVAIVLDSSPQIGQFQGTIVGTLQAERDGTMVAKSPIDLPEFEISYSDPDIKLSLYRLDEESKPMPLSWKVGSYLRGILVNDQNGTTEDESKKYKRTRFDNERQL